MTGIQEPVATKWSNPASKLIKYVVKLFTCFNIFALIRAPGGKRRGKERARQMTKTNHAVIEMCRASGGTPSPATQMYGGQTLNESLTDTVSSYRRFKSADNYVASTPIESLGSGVLTVGRGAPRKAVVTIINKNGSQRWVRPLKK